jgi:hypothetical protein
MENATSLARYEWQQIANGNITEGLRKKARAVLQPPPPEPLPLERVPAELKRLAERDDDTMRWINETNERIERIESKSSRRTTMHCPPR